jgi:putative endonuclease
MPMRGYVYSLPCSDGSYYVGHTNNLELRMWAHEHGEGGDYTSSRLPVTLVFSEELPSVHDAFLAERQVKGWSRAKKRALIRRYFEALVELSKNRQA